MDTHTPPSRSYRLTNEQIPPTIAESISATERLALTRTIKAALKQQNAVIVAHYYTDESIQVLAEDSGGHVSDSLDMARFGSHATAETLVVCGVRFMGETAKILNPEKRVLMPDLSATCSLDIGCPEADFVAFCDAHPDHTVVVYANTSAAVKARADWMVTSGSAVDVIRTLSGQGEKIIWAPDQYLGDYVQQQTGADMLIWQGACIVHEEFKAQELQDLRRLHPQAKVLVHPESPAGVIAQADLVSSTTGLVNAVAQMDATEFIVATDSGIFHKMRQAANDKILIEAPTAGKSATCISCAHCPWMAMNSLQKIAQVLATGNNEIQVASRYIQPASQAIERLLTFTNNNAKQLAGDA